MWLSKLRAFFPSANIHFLPSFILQACLPPPPRQQPPRPRSWIRRRWKGVVSCSINSSSNNNNNSSSGRGNSKSRSRRRLIGIPIIIPTSVKSRRRTAGRKCRSSNNINNNSSSSSNISINGPWLDATATVAEWWFSNNNNANSNVRGNNNRWRPKPLKGNSNFTPWWPPRPSGSSNNSNSNNSTIIITCWRPITKCAGIAPDAPTGPAMLGIKKTWGLWGLSKTHHHQCFSPPKNQPNYCFSIESKLIFFGVCKEVKRRNFCSFPSSTLIMIWWYNLPFPIQYTGLCCKENHHHQPSSLFVQFWKRGRKKERNCCQFHVA